VADRILVIDDDPAILKLLDRALTPKGFECRLEVDVGGAERAIEAGGFEAVLCDLKLGEFSALDLLKIHRRKHSEVPFLVITGYGDLESTVEVMRAGAFDFLSKPVDLTQVERAVRRAVESRRAAKPPEASGSPRIPGGLIGRAPCMVELFKSIARFAQADSPLLIEGETGSGKEIVARSVHLYSPRASKRLVAVNCAALPEPLLESELFGHVRGAFTGAVSDRPGLFREADGGTLFLDEVGDLAPALQAKLLRALQERRVRPVGGESEAAVDVRVLSATSRSLQELTRTQQFREDLLFRISTLRIRVPPLRERPEDIELLARAHLARLASKTGRPLSLEPAAVDALRAHAWPGNVRELQHALDRAAALTSDGRLTASDFGWLSPRSGAGDSAAAPLRSLEEVSCEHIYSVLRAVGWNKQKASEILKIDRKTLQRKLKAADE